jgi:transcriptional regulator with XRE-family HTH domain
MAKVKTRRPIWDNEGTTMSAEIAFSELLREQRRAVGYSQEDLAERAGLSVGAIGSLEQGLRRAPRRDTVRSCVYAAFAPDANETSQDQIDKFPKADVLEHVEVESGRV